MRHIKLLAPLLAATMMMGFAAPASAAGKADRARQAIAEAQGKIEAADAAGATTELPQQQASARHMLATAQEDLSAGRKEDAIAHANEASRLAEVVIGEAQKRKDMAASTANSMAQADADAARQQANDANTRAADAAARAADAERSAAVSAADAAAARASAATTVTTETTTTKPVAVTTRKAPVRKKTTVVRKSAPATVSATEKTTTTVTTAN